MKRLPALLIVLLTVGVLGLVATSAGARDRRRRPGSPLHPPVLLQDAQGESVLASGRPVSPEVTCGECHDTSYIESHSYHAAAGFDELRAPGEVPGGAPWEISGGLFGRWDPVRYRRLTLDGEATFDLGVADWIRVYGDRHTGGGPAYWGRDGKPLALRRPGTEPAPETHVRGVGDAGPTPWDWAASGGVEMNCFLCHLADPANEARIEALRAGTFEWAATATLAHTGLVEKDGRGGWRWLPASFDEDGFVERGVLAIRDPGSANCGLCHDEVHVGREPFRIGLLQRRADAAWDGQVFSGQTVSESALNLRDKESWARPWDVHAARLVECTDCHHALNNPVTFRESDHSRPRHLAYDARRLEIGDYLVTPNHHFTKGESAQGHVARRLDGTMRRCDGCHLAEATHEAWLPNPRRHLDTLLCETCHVPRIAAPARLQTDWTLLTAPGMPRVVWRGIEGEADDPRALITGYAPVILPRTQTNGRVRHGPHNLHTTWFWVSNDRPVRLRDLEKAVLAEDGSLHPDLRAALDADSDGRVTEAELQLDTTARVAAVRARLEAVGVDAPHIEGRIQPASLHHGVAPGAFATRSCETCHASASRMTEPFEIARYVPAGATATLAGNTNVSLPGHTYRSDGGALLYEPVPTASGRYVIGHDRAGWIDLLGAILFLGTLAAVTGHAILRWLHARRREGAAR